MAMVKLGAGIENISGKVGGDIWRWDQCRQHVQGAPFPVHRPPTPAQRKRRWGFFQCMRHFFHKLTAEQQNLWWVYSYNHPKKNKKGETTYMQPHMAFISVNLNRYVTDLPFLDEPPS